MVRILKKFIHCAKGAIFAEQLVRKNKDKVLVLSDLGIGDQVFMLSYIREWQKANNIGSIAIVTQDLMDGFYDYYSIKEDELVIVTRKQFKRMKDFFTSRLGNRYHLLPKRIFLANPFGYMEKRILVNPCNFNFSSLTKSVYKLSESSLPQRSAVLPSDALLADLAERGILVQDNTILMNPYARNCNMTPLSFFQMIADRLLAEGYQIITSIHGDQKPLEGTFGVHFPITAAVSLSIKCKAVVGARSGFMDLIALSGVRIACIDNEDYPYADLFLLENCWPQNEKIKTFRWGHSVGEDLVDKVVNYLSQI